MSQAAEEDKKPSGDQSAHINLKVKGQVFCKSLSTDLCANFLVISFWFKLGLCNIGGFNSKV